MKLLHSAASRSATGQFSANGQLSPAGGDRQPGGAGGERQRRKPTIPWRHQRGSVKEIYFFAPFDKPEAIQRAFKELAKIAGVHDWPGSGMYGLLGPHQRNSYKAFLPVDQEAEGTDKFTFTEIKGGTFATFKVRGDLNKVTQAAHHFYRDWLPDEADIK